MGRPRKKILEDLPFQYEDPEVIDNIIKTKLNIVRKGKQGSETGRFVGWTEREIQLRRMVVLDYFRQGLSVRRIMEQLMERWGIKEVASYKYINDALGSLTEGREKYVAKMREVLTEKIEGIMEQAMEGGQLREALLATEQLAKLYGCFSDKKEVKLDSGSIKFNFGDLNNGTK